MWKKIICWILVIIWLLVIYNFSAMNGENSNLQSRGFIISISEGIAKIAVKLNIIKEEPTSKEYASFAEKINFVIRKIAHSTIYFILSILILLALSINDKVWYHNVLLTVILCFIYSLTDEYHQTFIYGRAGQAIDCVIDTFGAMLGCGVYTLIWMIRDKKRKS